MIRIFSERCDSESPEGIKKDGYSYLFRKLHGGDIHALREGLSEGDLPLVILRIVLRFVDVVLARLVGGREVEYGALWCKSEFLECEQVCKWFDGGPGLTKS